MLAYLNRLVNFFKETFGSFIKQAGDYSKRWTLVLNEWVPIFVLWQLNRHKLVQNSHGTFATKELVSKLKFDKLAQEECYLVLIVLDSAWPTLYAVLDSSFKSKK